MSKTNGIASAHIVEPFGVRTGTINLSEIAAQELLDMVENHGLLEKITDADLDTWNALLHMCLTFIPNVIDFKFNHFGAEALMHSNRAKLTITAIGLQPGEMVVKKVQCVLETKVLGKVSTTGKVVDVSTIDGVKEIFTAVVQL